MFGFDDAGGPWRYSPQAYLQFFWILHERSNKCLTFFVQFLNFKSSGQSLLCIKNSWVYLIKLVHAYLIDYVVFFRFRVSFRSRYQPGHATGHEWRVVSLLCYLLYLFRVSRVRHVCHRHRS